jgi:hypothetical protein
VFNTLESPTGILCQFSPQLNIWEWLHLSNQETRSLTPMLRLYISS